jgi:hypothetical protein
MKNSA